MRGTVGFSTWHVVLCVAMCGVVCAQEVQEGEAAARVASLESKLKVVVAEVDRMQEQANLTARLQVRVLCSTLSGTPPVPADVLATFPSQPSGLLTPLCACTPSPSTTAASSLTCAVLPHMYCLTCTAACTSLLVVPTGQAHRHDGCPGGCPVSTEQQVRHCVSAAEAGAQGGCGQGQPGGWRGVSENEVWLLVCAGIGGC